MYRYVIYGKWYSRYIKHYIRLPNNVLKIVSYLILHHTQQNEHFLHIYITNGTKCIANCFDIQLISNVYCKHRTVFQYLLLTEYIALCTTCTDDNTKCSFFSENPPSATNFTFEWRGHHRTSPPNMYLYPSLNDSLQWNYIYISWDQIIWQPSMWWIQRWLLMCKMRHVKCHVSTCSISHIF